MGLFSSKKTEPQAIDIPADIMADVSVNGEKKVSPPSFSEGSSAGPSATTSPFLKSKGGTFPPSPAEPQEATIPPVVPPSPIIKESTPKPFQFSDQNPRPAQIHFTDNPTNPAPETSAPNAQKPDFSQITQDQALTAKQKEHLAPLKMPREGAIPTRKSFFSAGNLISLGVFILILGLISGGSWYYLNTRNEKEAAPEVSIDDLPEITGTERSSGETGILLDQPNYLVLDIETVTKEQIDALLNAEKDKLVQGGIMVPVEYLVVDTNNNPVAFSRFAFLVGADTPKDLTEASLEPFSLYLHLDQGALRLALAVTLQANTPPNFPANKSVLPQAMKKFFYPAEYASFDVSTLSFRESSYKNNTISYVNIDLAKNYSFDMIQQEGILTFANSKNTLRAVIDKRLTVPEE